MPYPCSEPTYGETKSEFLCLNYLFLLPRMHECGFLQGYQGIRQWAIIYECNTIDGRQNYPFFKLLILMNGHFKFKQINRVFRKVFKPTDKRCHLYKFGYQFKLESNVPSLPGALWSWAHKILWNIGAIFIFYSNLLSSRKKQVSPAGCMKIQG